MLINMSTDKYEMLPWAVSAVRTYYARIALLDTDVLSQVSPAMPTTTK